MKPINIMRHTIRTVLITCGPIQISDDGDKIGICCLHPRTKGTQRIPRALLTTILGDVDGFITELSVMKDRKEVTEKRAGNTATYKLDSKQFS